MRQRYRLCYCVLIVVLLAVVLVACQNNDVPDDVVVLVEETAVSTNTLVPPTFTPTPTPTFTPTPAPTQTNTAVPTNTPTPEPTLTPTPTQFPELLLTPEAPPVDTAAYRLVPWSPDHAHNLAILMQGYHEAMGDNFNYPTTYEIYNWSFLPAYYAYSEAQLLFPNDSRHELWQWQEIHNRAMLDNPQNEKLYRDMIINALNSGKIPFEVQEIEDWFYKHQNYFDFELQIVPLAPPAGYLSSHIITISSSQVGGITFWVLETEGEFLTHPLYDNLDESYSYFSDPIIGDLTGDGIPELIHLLRWASGGLSGGTQIIFDLSEFPPKQLHFAPQSIFSLNYFVQTRIVNNDKAVLHVDGRGVDCPSHFSSEFTWNGQWLEQTDFEIKDESNFFALCLSSLDWGLRNYTEAEKVETLTTLEAEFGDLRPTGNDFREEGEFPPDTQDEFRYLLAVNHAYLGHLSETVRLMQLIINSPSIPESQWIEPAATFLSIFHSPQDVYKACQAANLSCDLQLAVERAASTLPLSMYDDAIEQLVEMGVPVVKNGRFDFDNDGAPEHWFIVQHQPGGDYELWVLAASDEHLKAMFVDTVANLDPTLLLHSASYPSTADTFQFTIGNDEIYNFIRRLQDQEPYITKLRAFEPYVYEPSPEKTSLDRAIDDLLSGTDPKDVLVQFQTLADNPEFEPHNRYYYYLGLAYELLGDEEAAINAYLLAWQDCCDMWQWLGDLVTANPYAVMARAKLERVP